MSADKKISDLIELITPTDADLVPIVNSGSTKKITIANARTAFKGDKGDKGNTGADSTVQGPQGIQGTQGIQGNAGADAFTYIAYASDSSGTGFTQTFDPALNYIAIKSTTTVIVSPIASDFTGLWFNYKGAKGDKGDQGIQGNQGIQGLTGNNGSDGTNGTAGADAYVYIAYASDDTGTGFTLTFDAALNYIAVKTTTTAIPSPIASDFTGLWKNYKGATGATGPAGAGSGDVNGPATNTDSYLPQWNGADSKTLKDGLAVPAGGLAGLTALGGKIDKTTNITALNETGIADGEIAVFNLTNKDIRTSDKTIVTSLGADDTTVPTSKAVKDVTDGKENTGVAASAVSSHAALTTGVHGVGAGTIAKTSDIPATPTDATLTTTDVTTNDASTTKHGWLLKLTAPTTGLINYIGIAYGETIASLKALFDATAPTTQAFGDTAAVGTAATAARRDHKHAMMAAPTTVSGNSGSTDALKSATTTVNVASATAPSAGQFLVATSSTAATWQSIGTNSLIQNELPTATTTVLYTCVNAYIAGSLLVYRDGQRLTGGGADYTETTPASGTFTFITAPVSGSVIMVDYQKAAAATTFAADTVDGYHANSTPTANNIPVLDSALAMIEPGVARQAIINGGFTVNQRVYVSAATLASGKYGHDRWKAGSGGGDYSFTQLATSTVITIAANKTLIQVIEDKNVVGGSYTLSWTGTAQARYAVNSATPAGSYAASPIAITSQNAGTVMSIEFNAGTLSNVQLNVGTTALPFAPRSFQDELNACLRYYEKSFPYTTAPADINNNNGAFWGTGVAVNGIGNSYFNSTFFKVVKRIAPTMTAYTSTGGTAGNWTWYKAAAVAVQGAPNFGSIGDSSFSSELDTVTTAILCIGHWTAECEF